MLYQLQRGDKDMQEHRSLITPEMQQDIGVAWEPYVQEIDAHRIRKFVEAVGDPNPLWQDETMAKEASYGGIIAPPTFHVALDPFWRDGEPVPRWGLAAEEKTSVHGGDEVEYFRPIRPGDTITAIARIVELVERQGRQGRLLFIVREVTYENQSHEIVAKSRSSSIKVF